MLNCKICVSQVRQTRDEASAEGARGLASQARSWNLAIPSGGRLRPTSASIRRTQSCQDLGVGLGAEDALSETDPIGASEEARLAAAPAAACAGVGSASRPWNPPRAFGGPRAEEPQRPGADFDLACPSEVPRAQAPRQRRLWWRRRDHPACRGHKSALQAFCHTGNTPTRV